MVVACSATIMLLAAGPDTDLKEIVIMETGARRTRHNPIVNADSSLCASLSLLSTSFRSTAHPFPSTLWLLRLDVLLSWRAHLAHFSPLYD